MNLEAFRSSILWFSLGLVLNRTKYIILSIMVFQMGLTSVVVFYISIRLVTEIGSAINRLIGGNFNRLLRDEAILSDNERYTQTINDSLKIALFLGSLGFFITLLLSGLIAMLLKESQLSNSIRLFSVTIPFTVATNQILLILSMRARFREVVFFQYILETILVLSLAFLTIHVWQAPLYTILFWQVTANIFFLPLSLFFLKKSIPFWHPQIEKPKIQFNFTFQTLYTPLSVGLINFLDLLIIGYFLGSTGLGLYIAMIVGPHLIFAVCTNMFGMFAHTIANIKDTKRIQYISQKVLQYILIVATPLTLLLILYPSQTLDKIIQIHAPVDPIVIQLLSLTFYAKIFSWMAERILITLKFSRQNGLINIILSITTLLLLIIVTPRFGIRGVASILLVMAISEVLIKFFLNLRKTQISFISFQSLKVLFLALVIYIVTKSFMFSFFNFLILFAIFYLTGIIFLKIFEKTDLEILLRKYHPTTNNLQKDD